MTTKRMSEPDFDRLLTAWFGSDAQVREPETLLEDALARGRRSRRRPAWLLPEWWIPMQLTMPLRAVPRLAPILLLIVLLVVAMVAIAVVGSQPRLPDPFGPAANGRVAYLADGQIYAANPDGSNPIPLTFGIRSAATPSWSRDGTKFAYMLVSPRPGTENPTAFGDIVVADADGSNPITIDRETEDPSPPSWSPDGRLLAYSKVTASGDQVFIAAADGSSPPVRVGDPTTVNWAPIFSPDGTRVMYFVGYSGNGMGVMDTDGSDPRIANSTPFAEVDSATWHPDGNRIVVSARTGEGFDLWLLHLDGSPDQHLERPLIDEVGPSWSPDGRRLVYLTSAAGVTYTLAVANADGSDEKTLPGSYSHINPSWSPDGSRIAVVNDLGTVGRITLVDPDGAEPIQIEGQLPGASVVARRSSPTSWQRIAP
jgi:Tol biopolymer transport system component